MAWMSSPQVYLEKSDDSKVQSCERRVQVVWLENERSWWHTNSEVGVGRVLEEEAFII